MSGWINVNDMLPEQIEDVLVCVCGWVEIATFLGYHPDKKTPRFNTTVSDEYSHVTHWMPIPEVPK